jgi:phosphatidate cytidylyltransferase
MLRARVITAIVMLCLFLAAVLYLPAVFWMVVLLALTVTGSWEWSRLARFSPRQSIIYLLLTTLVGGELLFILSRTVNTDPYSNAFLSFYAASLIFWALIAPFLLKSKYAIKNPLLLALTGWLVLLPTSFALYQLRAVDPLLLLGFMATVWISDTAAYFIGRAFGKHKLAPNISPGKTWEGVAGALGVVFVYALLWSHFAGQEVQPKFLIPLLLVIVVLGILGDLFESLMKRQAGLKDSGNILPGHGGILDRIDALTSTLPVAVLSLLFFRPEL